MSIGVAPTKSAAKVASDYDKPDGLVVVQPGEVQAFFEPLDPRLTHIKRRLAASGTQTTLDEF